jgi:hypothetical protein
MADGRPIATLVTLQSGTTAWCWKIAYDETFARFSPGVQLLLDATQALLDDRNVARADSCATAGHPMIEHVWRERLALADRLVRVGPQHGLAFGLACPLERARRAVIAGLKPVRNAARGRSSRMASAVGEDRPSPTSPPAPCRPPFIVRPRPCCR